MRGSGKLRRNSHPAVLAHRAQEPSTLACDLPRFANSRVPVIAWVVRAPGVYSVAGVQMVSFPELPISISAGITVASGYCSQLGYSRDCPSVGTAGQPEADATAVEWLFAMADQTENSPFRKAVEARPSYCQAENNSNGRPKVCGGAPHKTGNPVGPLTARPTSRTRPVLCNPTRGYEC